MYRQFFQQIVSAVGSSNAKLLMFLLPPILICGLIALCSSELRKRLALTPLGGKLGLLQAFAGAWVRFSLGLSGLSLLCIMLLMQSGLFSERHGQVTQKNYEAVKSKWGVAHEQHELRVSQHVWERVTTEEFAGGSSRRTVLSTTELPQDAGNIEDGEHLVSDETFDVARNEKGKPLNPLAVVRKIVKLERKELSGGGVQSAKIDIELKSSPRVLGGATYAGFEDNCSFQYTVANQAPMPAHAALEFPLPREGSAAIEPEEDESDNAGTGLFNNIAVKMDGQPVKNLRYANGCLCWQTDLAAGAQAVVEIHYESRGLDYFRYWPGKFRDRYAVSLHLLGIPREHLNFPIGSMSPADELASLQGEDYTLHWDVSHAVTNFTMGVIVPVSKQSGFETSSLLKSGPLGLALLALVLVVTRLALGAKVELLPLGLSLLACYLGYATFANISDHTDSFAWAFIGGFSVPAIAGLAFWIARDGKTFLGVQSGVLHFLLAFGYPLALHWPENSGAVLHVVYTIMVAYVMFLAVRAVRRAQPPVSEPVQAAPVLIAAKA